MRRHRTRIYTLVTLFGLTMGTHAVAQTPTAPVTTDTSEDARTEARSHFDLGLSHFDQEEWQPALVEFLRSRELFPSKGNTKNAAICLRKVGRYDEALDMFERLVKEFPDLSPTDHALADHEIRELRASVGTIEIQRAPPGATVVVDGVERGKVPLAGPLRLSAGSHIVHVMLDGFLPVDRRVDLVGKQAVVLDATLGALTQAGRVHVAEATGKVLDVVLDGAVVGKTPWDGVVAPGAHAVLLRGEGNLGTQPVAASVKLNQTATLNLVAEELDASLRIDPKPPTASVSLDGVPLGRGRWEGRLRLGAHTVEVTEDGFLPFKRDVDLKKDAPEVIEAALARDPTLFAGPSARFGLELDAAVPLAVLAGGDVLKSCTGACSSSLPVGFHGVLHGIYQSGSGFGLGADVGYLVLPASISGRATGVTPINLATNQGTADDKLLLSGLTGGLSAQYRRGDKWPVLGRIGVGMFFGSMSDHRSGTFATSKGDPYTVDLQKSGGATYVYFAPEVRVGRRFGEHFELNVGVEVLLMASLSQPKWQDNTKVLTSNDLTKSGDGYGTFGEQTLLGSFVVFVSPGIGARYDF